MMSGRSDNVYKNRDLLGELSNLGLTYVILGVESGPNKILKYLKKGATVKVNENVAKALHDNNIGIVANIILGFLNETKEDLNLSLDVVRNIKPEICGSTTFTPYPGT